MSKFNLDWLLYPQNKEFFIQEVFEKNFLHVIRSKNAYYDSFLQLENLDELLGSRQFRFPSLRLTKAGEELTSEKYSNDKNIDASLVQKYFLDGYTIILNALHEQYPTLGEMVNGLSNDLGHPFQTNVYITPPNSQGFPAHYDTHDVFVLQIEGSKKWRIYQDSPVVLPTKQMEFQKEKHPAPESFTELELKKGDLLYIPRGVMHDAQTNLDLSIHVTLGWLGYTWTDVLVQMLLEYSKNQVAPRKFVDPFKSWSLGDLEHAFNDVLNQFAESNQPQNSLIQFRSELVYSQRFFFGDILKNAAQFNQFSIDSVFSKRNNLYIEIEKSSAEVILRVGAKEIIFPIFTFNTLDFILHTMQPFSIVELPDDLDDDGKIVLLKRLLKEGVITFA
jgi:hypothetical protein